MAMATSAPMKIAGNNWPTMASAMESERAIGDTGVISPPTVVRMLKLK